MPVHIRLYFNSLAQIVCQIPNQSLIRSVLPNFEINNESESFVFKQSKFPWDSFFLGISCVRTVSRVSSYQTNFKEICKFTFLGSFAKTRHWKYSYSDYGVLFDYDYLYSRVYSRVLFFHNQKSTPNVLQSTFFGTPREYF